ncbi:MAG: hypothetical protein COB14_03425 [Alphaproteobacteria bacterium]|nr:MAG: hypothetical protein COB14_03425 [Alphaproteobacteria bacterium]
MTDKIKKSQIEQDKKEDNSNLWEYATKDVTPLKNKNVADKQPKQNLKLSSHPCADKTRTSKTYTPPEIKSAETDYRTGQRLKRGKIPIEGRLDLHGKTQNEAYDALLNFIPNAYNQGKRCVLVITGKGSRQEANTPLFTSKIGILKQKTPQWLATAPLNAYILKIETARQNHGGEGALYVLLRRQR